MPSKDDPTVNVRLSPDGRRRLEALARARNVSLSRCVRQLVDEADVDAPRISRPALSETELLDLLRTRAEAGSVAAIKELLSIERARDPRAAALDALGQMARQ